MNSEQSSVQAGLRQFARLTNLQLASTPVGLTGSGEQAAEARRVLSSIGARVLGVADRVPAEVGLLILTDRSVTGPEQVVAVDRPLVVLDLAGALDLPAWQRLPRVGARPGVSGRRAAREVFLLDPAATDGAPGIDWARRFMPVTRTMAAELAAAGTVRGLRIGLSLVLEPKTAVLALALAEAGAEVSLYCPAHSRQDDVAAALRSAGLPVLDRPGDLLDQRPDVLVDDGATVTRLLHSERPELIGRMIGATEETTSGVRPLRVMDGTGDLRLPVIAVDDARTKRRFDNGHGTGQSTLFTSLDLLELDLTGRVLVVAGYGPVGRGVARHAAAFGAEVRVADPDPVAALEAEYAGHRTGPLVELVADAELVLSATGVRHTVGLEALRAMPDGCAVAVAGGVPQEVALDELAAVARPEPVADRVRRWVFDGSGDDHGVLVLDDGGCINCTAGEGNPVQIMDLSWGVQLSAIRFLVENAGRLPAGVVALPAELDDRVAAIALAERRRT